MRRSGVIPGAQAPLPSDVQQGRISRTRLHDSVCQGVSAARGQQRGRDHLGRARAAIAAGRTAGGKRRHQRHGDRSAHDRAIRLGCDCRGGQTHQPCGHRARGSAHVRLRRRTRRANRGSVVRTPRCADSPRCRAGCPRRLCTGAGRSHPAAIFTGPESHSRSRKVLTPAYHEAVLVHWAAPFALVLIVAVPPRAFDVEERRATGSLPAHVAAAFDEMAACTLSPAGEYLTCDTRARAVYTIAKGAEAPKRIVQIGSETGRIMRPTAFNSAPDGSFVVADAPGDQQRVQFFSATGTSLGGFTMPGRGVPQITLGDLVLSGLGTLEYTGQTVLISQ